MTRFSDPGSNVSDIVSIVYCPTFNKNISRIQSGEDVSITTEKVAAVNTPKSEETAAPF